MTNKVPTKAGFYWAKWKIAEKGTYDEDEFEPESHWRVVEVYDARGTGIVLVSGEEKTQSLENFYWGDKSPQPLKPPG